MSIDTQNWQKEAEQLLIQEKYIEAAYLYQQAIDQENCRSYYWHLGVLLLLQEQEAEAQTTWLLGMENGNDQEIEQWTQELIQVLSAEAERQEELKKYSAAWLIRQHIRAINPDHIDNLLHLVSLSIEQDNYNPNELTELRLMELLHPPSEISFDLDLLLKVLIKVIENYWWADSSFTLAKAALTHVHQPEFFLDFLLRKSLEIADAIGNPKLAFRWAELSLSLNVDSSQASYIVALLAQNSRNYQTGIELAEEIYQSSHTLLQRINANQLVIRGLMKQGGRWSETHQRLQHHRELLETLVSQPEQSLDLSGQGALITATFFFNYWEDSPEKNQSLRNQIGQLYQSYLETANPEPVKCYRTPHITTKSTQRQRPLKIGYLSQCLSNHSVGWLARWVFLYHNREKFNISAYCVNSIDKSQPLHQWYIKHTDQLHQFGPYAEPIVEKIYEDEIDILIDLDSLTLDTCCRIMAYKPAPIQVTWLGWDASGIPAIDYFIADPYVLPEQAQNYYSEKIWRLPQSYIGVDGFEIGIPTYRRDQFGIPNDAVVYLTTQRPVKYHPDTIRLHLKIIKQVPNSYFVIKGFADETSCRNFFLKLCAEEGVSEEKLRFLPEVVHEEEHRANLRIADVILDTYPYNGATTTLETLWLEIPMVTKVGQHFSSRNSYTMMVNAGLKEGIAWTDDEYIDWGIRLGCDPTLREQVIHKLRMAKHHSPLWNGKQFTQDLENAYEQMWQQYLSGNQS